MSEYTQRVCNSEHCGCKVSHSREWNHDTSALNWKCYNCGLLTPIRTRKPRPTENGLTKAQNKAVEFLRRRLILDHEGEYEYKRFEVKNTEGFVTLASAVGRKNDESTFAFLYQENRLIAIGTKGGLRLLNAKNPKESVGLHNVLFAERSY